MKFKEMKHALACATVQQKWSKEFSFDINQSRYYRRCAHNLRVAIAAHRGRHPGGSGRTFGIQAWNQRRRKVARRIALEANRTFWRTV
jgi:hypothetical protein